VGILFAIGLVVLFEYLDDTFRSIDEVGEVTKLSVLGAVQPYKQAGGSPFHAWQELHSGVAEAYRVIRTNIQFTSIDKSPGVITITSARDGEGKSTTAVNLAIAMALSQQRVLLVDADLRRQGLTSRFGYQQVSGLSDALINPGIDVGVTVEEVPNLTVVPAGPIPPNPAELLGSDRMTEWLEKQRNMYDVVILDSPPVLSVADGRILSAVSDAVVMLADPTISSRRLVKQARFALATVGTPIIGVVINKARFYSQESYYTYFYYDDKRETPHPLPVAGDPIASSPDRIQVS
jgi:capsular exopolysaccharide synthesis family protein